MKICLIAAGKGTQAGHRPVVYRPQATAGVREVQSALQVVGTPGLRQVPAITLNAHRECPGPASQNCSKPGRSDQGLSIPLILGILHRGL
jgi:hypothetical protein